MRKILWIVTVWSVFLVASFHLPISQPMVFAEEQCNLDTPYTPSASATFLRVEFIGFDIKKKLFTVVLGNGVVTKSVSLTGETARIFMNQLNTADLRNNSRDRRIIQRLINDSHIRGTISGSPD